MIPPVPEHRLLSPPGAWITLFAGVMACLLPGTVVVGQPGAAATDTLAPRFLGGARPLEASEFTGSELDVPTSAGLFVGVNEFGSDSGLPNLEYAVDDAVALAHVFVAELRVLPPERATLALGGSPRTPRGQALLGALESLGVARITAERQRVLTEILRLGNRATDPRGLVVLSFSTHGFERDGGVYLMPQDGLRELFWDTGLALNTIKDRLRQAKPNKKLLIYDACRREPTRGGGMSEAHRRALAGAEGYGILASCGTDEVSWEDAGLQHGVFTHFLLEGLRGAARADDADGLLRLESIAGYAADATRQWVKDRKGGQQEPWFELSGQARKIPLAANTNILGRIEADHRAVAERLRLEAEARQGIEARKEAAQGLLLQAQRAHRETFPLGTRQEIEAAIERGTGPELATLLEHLEVLRDARKVNVDGFLAWWRLNAGKWLAAASPPPVYGDQLASYTNSLRLVFITVPGTEAKFSVWETRVRDFRAFAQATGYTAARSNVWSLTAQRWKQQGATWEAPGFAQTEVHPVCGVSWEDAQAFCRWLTEKERQEGRIGPQAAYRLPRDAEWSAAAGSLKYVWGETWPPPRGTGNFAGEEARDFSWPTSFAFIEGYQDGYARTSPVGSFLASETGLYDLAGNVSEWCEDRYRKDMNTEELRQMFTTLADDGGGEAYRVRRGGAWSFTHPFSLASAARGKDIPDARSTNDGFRCVLAPEGSP